MSEVRRAYWPGLDGLRAFAVLAVVLFHAGLAPGGFLGVDVFFVISGFLITALLMREHWATGQIGLVFFWGRRVLRLYPALVATTTFVVIVTLVTNRAVRGNLHDAAASLVYIANLVPLTGGLLDHMWTLALEEQFYLVWPPLLLVALRSRSKWGYVPALVLLACVLVADLASGQDGPLHTYVRAMGLPLGCVLAFLADRSKTNLARFALPAGVAIVVLSVTHTPPWLLTGWPISVAAILAVPLVAVAAMRDVPLLQHALLVWIGRRSYGMYLWHFPILSLTIHHAPSAVPHYARVVVAMTTTFVVTALSYRYVEQPFLRKKERFRRASVGRPEHAIGRVEQSSPSQSQSS